MHDPAPTPRPEHRLCRRRNARTGVRLEYRRGLLGLGNNLAVALVDASEDGLRVRLKVEVKPGEEGEVLLGRPGGGKPLKSEVEVRWCTPAGDGTFLAGLRLRRRLPYRDLSDLVG